MKPVISILGLLAGNAWVKPVAVAVAIAVVCGGAYFKGRSAGYHSRDAAFEELTAKYDSFVAAAKAAQENFAAHAVQVGTARAEVNRKAKGNQDAKIAAISARYADWLRRNATPGSDGKLPPGAAPARCPDDPAAERQFIGRLRQAEESEQTLRGLQEWVKDQRAIR